MKANKAWSKRNAPADTTVTVSVFKYADGSKGIRLYNYDGGTFEIRLDASESRTLGNHLIAEPTPRKY